jgi:imidazole glycerol-phosphate synthase subunit HisH
MTTGQAMSTRLSKLSSAREQAVELTNDRTKALEADGLVVPGVGAYQSVMEALTSVGGASVIDQRISGGRSVLGICVGLQIMFDRGLEHGVDTQDLASGLAL